MLAITDEVTPHVMLIESTLPTAVEPVKLTSSQIATSASTLLDTVSQVTPTILPIDNKSSSVAGMLENL